MDFAPRIYIPIRDTESDEEVVVRMRVPRLDAQRQIQTAVETADGVEREEMMIRACASYFDGFRSGSITIDGEPVTDGETLFGGALPPQLMAACFLELIHGRYLREDGLGKYSAGRRSSPDPSTSATDATTNGG